jgi:hypothetical protein
MQTVSSFFNLPTAEWAVADLLANNHSTISEWLAKETPFSESLEHEYHREIGYYLDRTTGLPLRGTKKLRVILVRDPRSLAGYRIITGFPII